MVPSAGAGTVPVTASGAVPGVGAGAVPASAEIVASGSDAVAILGRRRRGARVAAWAGGSSGALTGAVVVLLPDGFSGVEVIASEGSDVTVDLTLRRRVARAAAAGTAGWDGSAGVLGSMGSTDVGVGVSVGSVGSTAGAVEPVGAEVAVGRVERAGRAPGVGFPPDGCTGSGFARSATPQA